MRILMVNKFLYPRGGAESYALKLGECFAKAGHEVEYFGMYDKKNTVGNSLGLYTQNMDFHSKAIGRMLYPFKIIYSFAAKRKIGRVLDSFRPDIVHMNNINFQLTPSIIYAVKKRKIPLVQTVHDYQMICPNHLLYNFMENKPCMKCVEGSSWNCLRYRCIHLSGVKSFLGVIEADLYSAMKTYKLVDLYICPSHFLERKLIGAKDFYSGKTFVLHNFINKAKMSEGYDKQNPYLVFAGRISKEKGVTLLARTARILPEYKFVVAGNGPDEAELRDIPNIQLAGFLTGDALQKVMAKAKALIAPSICYENCPLTILEAHSMGVPVITMACGGMAELVEDGVTGALIRTPDPEHVAGVIKSVLDNEENYMRIRENCKKRSYEILSAEDYSKILLDQYRKLITRREML